MPLPAGGYSSGPSCWDRMKMGFAMGFCVGMCTGGLFGGFNAFRMGLRGRELVNGVGKVMVQGGECLKLANKLVSASGLTQSTDLEHIHDLDRNFFKDLFATVFGNILPGDEESTAVFYRALLTCLSDILNISLEHIDPIDVAKKDAVALYHLIELCLTYVQHLVEVDSSKGAFVEVSAFQFDERRKSDLVDASKREQTRSSGSNSTDTEALLRLGDESKYLRYRVDSKLLLDVESDQNTAPDQNVDVERDSIRVPRGNASVTRSSVARNKSERRQALSDGSTWENILEPYLKQPKAQDFRTKKVVRLEESTASKEESFKKEVRLEDSTASKEEPFKKEVRLEESTAVTSYKKELPQKYQVDAGVRKRSQSSHHYQREKKQPTGKPLEEFLRDEFPALDLPPDTVNLMEKKLQLQNRYVASNLGFYHTQRRLIQKQLTELEQQRRGILKSKRTELEHWNRREDERDAADVRIKTRAALRDERMAKARYKRMLKEEEEQRRKLLLANNEDLVFRHTVDHILKSQRERLTEKKKERVEDFQDKMTKTLGELDQLNRNYQERISRITAEIMEKQKRDDSRGRAKQQNWRERRKRLIKNVESTRKQVVRGARETHYRKKDEEKLKKDINKAAFNFEVHDTDV